MKLNVGDKVVVQLGRTSLRVIVEDASKGDVIMAKVAPHQTHANGADAPYVVGKVYEFSRKQIVETKK